MTSPLRYLAILKGKQGEYGALSTLAPEVKRLITPLLEIIPPRPNKRGVTKALTEYIENEAERIADCWGTGDRILADVRYLSAAANPYPLKVLCDRARALGVPLVPVASTDAPRAIVDPARYAYRVHRSGLCLRESPQAVLATSFPADLTRTLRDFDANPSTVDFVLDMGAIRDETGSLMPRFAASAFSRIPYLDQWRSVTLAASSFPVSLAHLGPGFHTMRRAEWALWESVCQATSTMSRAPGYGDYTVVSPGLSEGRWPGSATIRYTCAREVVIERGRGLLKHGTSQYVQLARHLLQHDSYVGASYSWGDEYVAACASGSVTAGNATRWVQVGVNHHLTYVARQVASIDARSRENEQGSA